MFDLNREVEAWSAAVHAERCQPNAGVAELTDHLYCEIEAGRAAGLSDEEAFRGAIAKLGSAPELAAEHVKNRSALGTVCQLAGKLGDAGLSARDRRLLIAHGIVWATLIIASSFVLTKVADVPSVSRWLVLVTFVPLWWASEQILRRAIAPQVHAR
jgi:hypothetical protein